MLSPPIIIARDPSKAFEGPPDTGASTQETFFFNFTLSAKRIVLSAEVVDKSTIIEFSEAFCITPFSPKTTSSTFSVLSTHIKIKSHSFATAEGF